MARTRIVLALIGALAVTACSDIGQPFNTPNAEPVCIAAAGLHAQINTLQALDPSTASLEEYQTAAYNVSGYAETLVDQARVLANAEAGQLDTALQELQRAAQQLPAGTSPADAKTQLSEEIAAAKSALVDLNTKINCPPLPTVAPG
jgi:hypothetical protein